MNARQQMLTISGLEYCSQIKQDLMNKQSSPNKANNNNGVAMNKNDKLASQLGMNKPITRRDFINGTLATSAVMLCGLSAPSFAEKADSTPSRPQWNPWTGYGGVGDYSEANGNTYNVVSSAHRIRDNTWSQLPSSDDVEHFDLVIVGGGPAGMLAAYEFQKLTQGRKRCLLLDNHAIFGGASKQNDFMVDGVRLTGPQAANDFAVPAPGSGTQMDKLFTELELPRQYDFVQPSEPFQHIRLSTDNYTNMDGIGENLVDVGYYFSKTEGAPRPYFSNNIWADKLKKTPFSATAKRDLLAWRQNQGGNEGLTDFALDNMSYSHFLSQIKGYDKTVLDMARPLVGLLTGLSPENASAKEASHFVMNLKRSIPSFPGGNSAFTRALARKINPHAISGDNSFSNMLFGSVNFAALDSPEQATRMRLSATAVKVEHQHQDHQSDKVEITYEQAGTLHKLTAGQVIMASGGWVNRHILTDMPKVTANAYEEFIHAPALVINVALSNWKFLAKLGVGAVRWFDDEHQLGFCGNLRAPMQVDGHTPPMDPNKPAIFTLYMGLYDTAETDAKRQTMAGRIRMFSTQYADYELMLRRQMTRMFSKYGFDAKRDIAGIVLNRWGHARLARPAGFMMRSDGSQNPLEIVKQGYGRIIIAHSELNGAQNANGAFQHGARAAKLAAERI
ncbi:FAD/NAD(P)-binding protein [Shewanella sp. Isolate11]|uniref:NAD(P)-binding protein n=1 Tax=Shewanella sp. Isolate11 TaxID=2908530 RepID=UPI001EFD59F9|nr:FAD/NAD(P)-binding protein [Shewanella sp. Isolate11]MCG9695510.1 NAD(P)/FAD-dependent oxidoreductase [Shewanella sp. Isolate11]